MVFLGSWEADQEVVDLVVVLEEVGLEELMVVGQMEELKVVGQLEKSLHREACLARWAKVVEVRLGQVYCCCSLEWRHHLNSNLKMMMMRRMKGADCCDEVQRGQAQLGRWENCQWGRESPDLCLQPNIFLSQ